MQVSGPSLHICEGYLNIPVVDIDPATVLAAPNVGGHAGTGCNGSGAVSGTGVLAGLGTYSGGFSLPMSTSYLLGRGQR